MPNSHDSTTEIQKRVTLLMADIQLASDSIGLLEQKITAYLSFFAKEAEENDLGFVEIKSYTIQYFNSRLKALQEEMDLLLEVLKSQDGKDIVF